MEGEDFFKEMKRVAIVGAGYAGLAVSYYLTELKKELSLTLFDSASLGENTSGMAVGLMHPYMGIFAKKSWKAEEAMQESLKLFQIVEKELAFSVFSQKGIFRPLLELRQKEPFETLCQKEPLVHWWKEERVRSRFGSFLFPGCEGIFLEKGVLVESKKYLQGLWQIVEKRGVCRVLRNISSLKELKDFDTIFICTGARTLELIPSFSSFLQKRKGQVIEGEWDFDPLFCPVLGRGHITFQRGSCFLGSTYELETCCDEGSRRKREELLARIAAFLPLVGKMRIRNIFSGTRLFQSKSYLPYVGSLDERVKILTAFGSRGLLYHAFFAKKLVQSLV